MSPVEGFAIVGSVLVSCVPVMRWQIRRARRADAKRDQILREACEDNDTVSPNDPRLPAGINAYLDDYAALDPQLAPVFAPGVERLWKAIRDEQQKGDL